ncbi:MAG: hypothetical protein AAGI30_05050 [Planctomycetota bacterium]
MTAHHAPHRRVDTGAAALWASAFVLMAMVIVRAGDAGQVARASTQKTGTISVSALETLEGVTDLIVVADDRTDELFVYEIEGGRGINLVQYRPVADLFPEPPASP